MVELGGLCRRGAPRTWLHRTSYRDRIMWASSERPSTWGADNEEDGNMEMREEQQRTSHYE